MIIFINGTISSGKSTVAKLLSEKIPNTAVLEIDSLRDFISWMPLKESIPINLENALSVIKNFVKRKINVVVPYPLSEKNYKFFTDNLSEIDTEIFVFTLNPDPEVLIKSKRGRTLDTWEKERIKYHNEIGLTKPTFGKIIDNTEQTPDETVEEILKMCDF